MPTEVGARKNTQKTPERLAPPSATLGLRSLRGIFRVGCSMHWHRSTDENPRSMARAWRACGTFLLVVVTGCGVNVVAPSPAVDTTVSRIINGQPAGDLPAVGQFGGCTGTVIAPRLVLTAAHCLTNHVAADFTFKIGSNSFAPDYELPVIAIQQNPGYDGDSKLDNDLGLLTLGVDAPVQPIAVINQIDANWVGQSISFLGYGATDGNTLVGQGLKRRVMDAISSETGTRIRFGSDGNDVCYGDSGGPGIFVDAMGTSYIVSVTSFTEVSDASPACTGFSDATRVDAYLSFIGVPTTAPVMTAPAPSANSCQGETTLGRCVGNTLHYCQNGNEVVTIDCTDSAGTCGWSYSNTFYACLTSGLSAPTPSPTPAVTPVAAAPTPSASLTPSPVVGTPTPVVTPTPTPSFSTGNNPGLIHAGGSPSTTASNNGCHGESYQGRCENNVSIWCYNNSVVVQNNCTAAGAYCGWNSKTAYFDCLSPTVSN